MPRIFPVMLSLLLLSVGSPLGAQSLVTFDDSAATAVESTQSPVPESADGQPPGEVADEEEPADTGGGAEEEGGTIIDTAHAAISSGVLGTANWLDSFFSDPRIEIETTKTRLKARFSYLMSDGEPTEYDANARYRLDLPILEKRLHLLVDGDPEEDEDEDQLENFVGEEAEKGISPDDGTVTTSLRYFLKQTLYKNFSVRSGVRWRDGIPMLFVEPRYRQTFPLDPWQLRFTQRVFAFSDGKEGVRTTFDYERELHKPFFFRATADGSWESDEKGYFYRFVFSLYQRFSSRRVLIYNWGNNFITEPRHRLDSVVFSARYRQRIMRDWLFYEIVPQVSFPESRDFKETPALLLRIEMLFGYYPKLPPPPE